MVKRVIGTDLFSLSMAAALLMAGSSVAALAQSAPSTALTGTVTAQPEGAMEGVVVSAKKAGSTITVSVISNAQGQYGFPRDRLSAGTYNVTIRAAGYSLPSQSVQLSDSASSTLNLNLAPVTNPTAIDEQLSNAEWLESIPGTAIQKQGLTSCVDCHTLQRPIDAAFSPADMAKVLVRMGSYPPNSQPHKVQLLANPSSANQVARPPTSAQVSLANYVASINLSDNSTHPFAVKRLPRPTGKSTQVIMTTYDLPRPDTEVHDAMMGPNGLIWYSDFGSQYLGSLDPKTGKVTEYPIPMSFPGRPDGSLDLRADTKGNLYIANMGQSQMAVFDSKSGKFTASWIPPDKDAPGDTRITMLDPTHSDADGKVWVKSAVGVFQVSLTALQAGATPATAGTMIPTSQAGPTRGYGTVSDKENNVYHLLNDPTASVIPKTDAKTLQTEFFNIPSGDGGCRRGHVDAQDRLWCTQYATNRIAMLDPATKKVTQYDLPTNWTLPYDVEYDNKGYMWTAGMGNDLAVRLNVQTGEYTQYLMPQDTNVRRVDVDSSTQLSSLWVGNNYAPQIVHIEPLTP